MVVSYRNSTSNHNCEDCLRRQRNVVSYRNSTSNHNLEEKYQNIRLVVSYRNSTSNHNKAPHIQNEVKLYLIEILHQTTTYTQCESILLTLYLIEILHQTTTRSIRFLLRCCCILSKFYIKPQPPAAVLGSSGVGSYRNSTSNHNLSLLYYKENRLYLIEILHQTTTATPSFPRFSRCILSKFYIKPQRGVCFYAVSPCCILSKFYIKPQPEMTSSIHS